MNYVALQAWLIDDCHREDYVGNTVQKCIEEGEDRIFARLESYLLTTILADAQRIGVTGEYTMPGKVIEIRYVTPPGQQPLDKTDETLVAQYATAQTPLVFVPRDTTLVIAGTPGVGSTFSVQYFGLPARLAVTADNSLAQDCGLIYKKMAQVSIFQRMHDYESAQIAFQEGNSLIDEVNRQMKKKLGGRRSANPYNVSFRSSY
jgi:hypothetical protein